MKTIDGVYVVIRQLDASDREGAIELLSAAPEYNLYVLGNLNSVGFDQPEMCEFWGDFGMKEGNQKQLRAILNRYMSGWVVYGHPDADWAGLGNVLNQHPIQAERLQDNPGGIESFVPYISKFDVSKKSEQTFMVLTTDEFEPTPQRKDIKIRKATLDDVPALTAFYANAGHMSRTTKAVVQPIRRTRLWLAERDGAICAAALTNAETDQVAMIGGVYTPPEYRSNGYSGAVCSALCADLLTDGKKPVLYWETPAAGKVYMRLGFQKIGTWRSLRLKPTSLKPTNLQSADLQPTTLDKL